jgi:glycerol-3-phosphate acyltransferase PlsX
VGAAERSPTIAVDANGADDRAAVVRGAVEATARGHRVLLFGAAAELDAPGVEVVDAPRSIAKAADPVRAVREHPDASIVQAARAVADGRADALVAGGTTGAALAAGLFNIKRAKGVHRPALALPLPIPGAPVTLLDVGANDVCRAEHLQQFAFMGAAFASAVLGIARPRVGLLSNGTEPGKGRDEVVAAHALLAEDTPFDFVGNVEGFGLTEGAADVVVTDGFTGNVALKLMEGVSKTLLGAVRAAAMASPRAKAGGLLLKPSLRGLRDEIDPEAVGGAYLLGLRRLAVVPHGSFSARGFAEAIARADRGVREDLVGRTHAGLDAAGALRRVPASDAPSSLSSR